MSNVIAVDFRAGVEDAIRDANPDQRIGVEWEYVSDALEGDDGSLWVRGYGVVQVAGAGNVDFHASFNADDGYDVHYREAA